VAWSIRDNRKHVPNERNRHPRVEQIAHRVDEDDARIPPPSRGSKVVRVDGYAESWPRRTRVAIGLILGGAHSL
jgi:hypothetical protein